MDTESRSTSSRPRRERGTGNSGVHPPRSRGPRPPSGGGVHPRLDASRASQVVAVESNNNGLSYADTRPPRSTDVFADNDAINLWNQIINDSRDGKPLFVTAPHSAITPSFRRMLATKNVALGVTYRGSEPIRAELTNLGRVTVGCVTDPTAIGSLTDKGYRVVAMSARPTYCAKNIESNRKLTPEQRVELIKEANKDCSDIEYLVRNKQVSGYVHLPSKAFEMLLADLGSTPSREVNEHVRPPALDQITQDHGKSRETEHSGQEPAGSSAGGGYVQNTAPVPSGPPIEKGAEQAACDPTVNPAEVGNLTGGEAAPPVVSQL